MQERTKRRNVSSFSVERAHRADSSASGMHARALADAHADPITSCGVPHRLFQSTTLDDFKARNLEAEVDGSLVFVIRTLRTL